jgi:hypothetical protein
MNARQYGGVALATLALAGCVALPNDWVKVRDVDQRPYTYQYIHPDDTDRVCREHGATGDGYVLACAVYGKALFVLPFGASQDLIEHEEKHRLGYEHR